MSASRLTLCPLECGRAAIEAGAISALRGQARDYWPVDTFDEELRAMLAEEEARDARV